jgi:protein-disulfide isomerase
MSDGDPRPWSRRRLLAAGGAAAVGGFAGCISTFESGGAAEDTTTRSTDGAGTEGTTTDGTTDSGTGGESRLGGHPAARRIADQPRLGPPPTEADGVVVAFEDPSCPRCAAFETETVPKLREQAGDRVSFVLRSYPVVYPWGEPATQAIEAAFAREMEVGEMGSGESGEGNESGGVPADAPYGFRQGSEATWALVRHYFEEQSQFGEENVFEKTRTFLAEETDLDAEAVVDDAEAKQYDDAVQADLSAGEAADVGRTTPTIFLFRDGEFRTSAKGSISFEVVEAALEL